MDRIGCGAGFSGNRSDAPQAVVAEIAAAGEGGAIIFETLAERMLALRQTARHDDPPKGYEPQLEDLLESILGPCLKAGIVIVGNFGAANPVGAAVVVSLAVDAHGKCLSDLVLGMDIRVPVETGDG